MLKAYVTNLGKYNEGELCGEYLELPAKKEDLQALFARISIDGVLYEEYFITDYDTDIVGLCRHMGEYESLDELNYFANMLAKLDEGELVKFEAAIEYGEYTSDVQQLINLVQNLDCYNFNPDVTNEEELGIFYADMMELPPIPESLENYIDFEAYGRDMSINDGGVFTKNGYIKESGDRFIEHYTGQHVPDDYRIFAYPDTPDKMPMKQQLDMYKSMAESQATTDSPTQVRHERA